uniref:Uncharacterized protein n=1 Tax=Ditylenchus dipsaci TaxID=166011 RepID=A0A915DY35_9BILA
MTYKKYIDLRLCCFIPGKVLDLAFGVMRQIIFNLPTLSWSEHCFPLTLSFQNYDKLLNTACDGSILMKMLFLVIPTNRFLSMPSGKLHQALR